MSFQRFLTSLATVVVIATISRTLALNVVNSYRDPHGNPLLSMDYEPQTGALVVSSSKSVAKLNSELYLEDITSCKLKFSGIQNIVINKDLESVILCSSAEGRCNVNSLEELNKELQVHPSQLLPKSLGSNSSAVLLLTSAQTMLIANDFFRSSRNTVSVPMLSSRSTINLSLMHASTQAASAKYVTNLRNLPQAYSVMYSYAFVYKNFAYLVSRVSDVKKPFISSRISRLCLDDKSFTSYVEISLGCGKDTSISYPTHSTVQSAYFDQVSTKLFVSFANNGQGDLSSAVCGFKLHDLDLHMDKAVYDCSTGKGKLGPAHFQKQRKCFKTVSYSENISAIFLVINCFNMVL